MVKAALVVSLAALPANSLANSALATESRPKVLLLMGPTAAGKTAVALHLADHIPSRLISVDSALIYRDMNIGTAKPSPQELLDYPHALVDIIQPQDAYSAAQFVADASFEIEKAHADQKLPILVGGTMLYFKALVQGLTSIPSADLTTRQYINAQIEEHGSGYAHQWLEKVDQESAQRLHPQDRQRIERALEIFLQTGEKMSTQYKETFFQKGWDQQCLAEHQWDILPIALAPSSKQLLHPVIKQRFDSMLKQGLLDEVGSLMKTPGIHRELASMRCVGYRQAWSHLLGEISKQEFQDHSCAATRQLAKRQMTWLRNWTTPQWHDSFDTKCSSKLLRKIEPFLQG